MPGDCAISRFVTTILAISDDQLGGIPVALSGVESSTFLGHKHVDALWLVSRKAFR